MTKTLLLLPLVASLALAACNSESHTLVQNGPADPMAEQLKNAPAVELPPAIAATKSYRCKDSSVVYLDWLAGGKGANFRATKDSAPTQLKPDAEGKPPFTAEGFSLTGTAEAASVTLTRPGKGSQSCKG
jgi:hypothetical protein